MPTRMAAFRSAGHPFGERMDLLSYRVGRPSVRRGEARPGPGMPCRGARAAPPVTLEFRHAGKPKSVYCTKPTRVTKVDKNRREAGRQR
jgi:hypothetical protein